MAPSGWRGVGLSFREDLALSSPSQTPGQEPVGPGPASLVCMPGEGGGESAAWALAQEDPSLGNWQDSTACLQGSWE